MISERYQEFVFEPSKFEIGIRHSSIAAYKGLEIKKQTRVKT